MASSGAQAAAPSPPPVTVEGGTIAGAGFLRKTVRWVSRRRFRGYQQRHGDDGSRLAGGFPSPGPAFEIGPPVLRKDRCIMFGYGLFGS